MQQPRDGLQRPAIGLIFAITVSGVTVNTLPSPAIPDILDGLGASRGLAGVVLATASLPGIVMAPVIGLLADRYGRREVLVPCLVIFAVAGGLVAVAPALWVLMVLRFLQGVGGAGLINLGVVLIGDHWQGTERAAMIGRNAAALTVAVAAFPMLGGALTDLGGWRAPFLLYPLGLITAVMVARSLPRSPRRQVSIAAQVREAVPFLRMPIVLKTLASGTVMMILIFGAFFTVMPLYADERFGLGAGARGIVLALPAITALAGSLSLAVLKERFGDRVLFMGSWLIFGLSLVLIASANHLLVLGLGALVFGVGQGVLVPALQDVAAGVAPESSRGAIFAVWVSSVRLGQTAGPMLAGGLAGAAGSPAAFATGAAASVAMSLLFVRGRGSEAASDGARESGGPAIPG